MKSLALSLFLHLAESLLTHSNQCVVCHSLRPFVVKILLFYLPHLGIKVLKVLYYLLIE